MRCHHGKIRRIVRVSSRCGRALLCDKVHGRWSAQVRHGTIPSLTDGDHRRSRSRREKTDRIDWTVILCNLEEISQIYIYIFVDWKRIRRILFPLNLRLEVHLNRYVFSRIDVDVGRVIVSSGERKLLETITSSNSFMHPLLLFHICRAVSLLISSARVCEAIQADLTPDSLIQQKQRPYRSRHTRAKKISKETFSRFFFFVRRFSSLAGHSSIDENAPVLSLSVLLSTYVLSKYSTACHV